MGSACCQDRNNEEEFKGNLEKAPRDVLNNVIECTDGAVIHKVSDGVDMWYERVKTVEVGEGVQVELVKDLVTGHRRHLTIINTGNDSDRLKNVKREIDIMRKLDHPNISKLKVCYQDDSHLYLVSETLGIPLRTKLFASMSFSEGNAATVIKQVLSLVAHCHKQGIMLRTLSMDSLYVSEDGELEVKLVDVKEACYVGRHKVPLTHLTESTAPDLFTPSPTPQCDIFSCGFLLFSLISGESPYLHSSSSTLEDHIKSHQIVYSERPWRGRSPLLMKLIDRMMDANPDNRPSAMTCLTDPWLVNLIPVVRNPGKDALLEPLKGNRPVKGLKKAVFEFIITRVLPDEVIRTKGKAFQSLDVNSDGDLNIHDIVSILPPDLPSSESLSQANQILSFFDQNKNSVIDFSEFLSLSFDEKTVLSSENINKVFRLLDRDQDGFIVLPDLKEYFESNSEEIWRETLHKAGKKLYDRVLPFDFEAMLVTSRT